MMKSTKNMCYVSVLLVSLLETRNTVNGGPAPQYFTSTPQNTTVTAGHRAMLSCSVGNIVGTCQWTKDGLSVDGVSRYQLGSDRNGLCDLTIDPTLPIDEGVYHCQVSGGQGVAPISSAPVSLSVNSEPGQPYIVQAMEDEVMEVKEGEEVELQCESQRGRPPAEIQWWDEEGRRIVSDVTEHVRRMEDRKTFKTVSTLKMKPSIGQLIKCSAHNDVFPAGRMSSPIQIGTKSQPEVEVEELEVGVTVEIICQKEPNNGILRLKWLINDAEIFDENKNILELQQFSKSYDNSYIKCLIEDKFGQFNLVRVIKLVHKARSLIDTSKPTKTSQEISGNKSKFQRSEVKEGKNVKKRKTMFSCVMDDDSSEEPKYVLIDGLEKDMTSDEVVNASNKENNYKCKVIAKGIYKLNKIAQDVTSILTTMNDISKTLNEISSFRKEDENTFVRKSLNISS